MARRATLLSLPILGVVISVAASCTNEVVIPGAPATSAPFSPTPTVTATTTVVPTPSPIASSVASGVATSVNSCTFLAAASSANNLVLAGAPALSFGSGTEVLMIQVQDAYVPRASVNDDVVGVGEAGRFDVRVVADVVANGAGAQLELDRPPSISYSSGGARAAEICSVPFFTTLSVAGTIEPASAWNGTAGGIVAIRAQAISVTASGRIDASADGFRGGGSDGADQGLSNSTRLACGPGTDGGDKGGTLAPYGSAAKACASAPGTGGGGGDIARAGGGGGGNGGIGGTGGQGPTVGSLAGAGGGPVAVATLQSNGGLLLFGGGGGGGSPNGASTGTKGGRGGHGGGIVLLLGTSDTLSGAGFILADGEVGGDVPSADNGGGGGGGAGGTIRIEAKSYTGALTIEAVGGDGGNETLADGGQGDGPGGGGAGGVLAAAGAIAPVAGSNVAGGFPGSNGAAATNGAGNGGAGKTLGVAKLPAP